MTEGIVENGGVSLTLEERNYFWVSSVNSRMCVSVKNVEMRSSLQ